MAKRNLSRKELEELKKKEEIEAAAEVTLKIVFYHLFASTIESKKYCRRTMTEYNMFSVQWHYKVPSNHA